MTFFEDMIANPTLAGARTTIRGYAESAGLKVTNWVTGAVAEQVLAASSIAAYTVGLNVAKIVRGFVSLDTSTDPGDDDAYDDTSADADQVPGMLSAFGENTFGTMRGEKTFANGFFTFDNSAGLVARTFGPGGLTFTWTLNTPPSPRPTYRNAPDASIYVDPGNLVTVNAGATLIIPIVAEEIGTRSNAPPSAITMTTTLVGVTGTNALAVLGTDREDAEVYRARCRQAASRLSLGGAAGIYAYLAAKALDGTPLVNADDDEVAITRVYVSEESATGNVDVYYASASGAAVAADVEAANDNISLYALAVPGGMTFGPGVAGGQAATAVAITVVGTGKIKRVAGVADSVLKAAAEAAAEAAVGAAFEDFPIGGVDQVAGAGVIYTTDLRAVASDAYSGLYNVLVTTPAGASTALALGQVATLTSATFTVTVVA